MLERTGAKTNEVLEPITFVLAYVTAFPCIKTLNSISTTQCNIHL